jgi:hypothetical protein
LIADAEHRLRQANKGVEKIDDELAELKRRLAEAEQEGAQLDLPLPSRTRGLSDKWATVLSFMVVRSPNAVSIDEILQFAAENRLAISRAAARAQLHNYEKRGFVQRISDGLYLATPSAKAYCEY